MKKLWGWWGLRAYLPVYRHILCCCRVLAFMLILDVGVLSLLRLPTLLYVCAKVKHAHIYIYMYIYI